MSKEARVQSNLTINKLSSEIVLIRHNGEGPSAFQADVDGTIGPLPGSVSVPTTGKIIDLSELTTPGLYEIHNQDATNYVEYGIYDPQTDVFYPWGELLPGEKYVGRFSRNLAEEYTGTGTGTTAATNKVMLKAQNASCNVYIGVFEK